MNDRPRYMISVAAELAGMHPQTLRAYEAKGLVRPARTPGGTRLYSEADVERLSLIQQLTTKLGLNLAGVEHVLRLEDELRRAPGADGAARGASCGWRSTRPTGSTGASWSSTSPRSRRHGNAPRTSEEYDHMDFNKLTIKSGEAVAGAQELARRAGNPELTRDHLTVALLEQELPRTLLQRAGRRPRLDARRGRGARARASRPSPAANVQPQAGGGLPEGARRRVRRGAEARRRVRLRRAPRCSRSSSSRARTCSTALKEVRGGQRVTTQDPEGTYEALSKFGRDLTAAAESGKLDPVIGRDEEIRRVDPGAVRGGRRTIPS